MNQHNPNQLSQVIIKGLKSIKNCDLELKNINVLIGSNGAGKSNFISAFTLLQNVLEQNLSRYTSRKGVDALLHKGAKVTDSIEVEVFFGTNSYAFELEVTDGKTLMFREERIVEENSTWGDGGYGESKWSDATKNSHVSIDLAATLSDRQWRTYHFQDTTPTSKIKAEHNLSNCDILRQDASNLAAFLYRLKQHYSTEYKNIVESIRLIAPYFKDFVLEPNENNKELIVLRWQEIDCEDIFNASQLSDGTLRFICLATLLLQPTTLQPATIIIDEPELGLHPLAIVIFAELVKKAAVNKQIILSTQSAELLDNFDADDVVVVDRGKDKDGSQFSRLNSTELSEWLEDYTLGELWNKNILGGRFSR